MIFNRILIALSEGPITAHAVDVGIALAHTLHANAALIHVMEPPASAGAVVDIPPAELTALARQEGRRLLDGVRQRLSLKPSVQEFLEFGNPSAEIIKAARAWPADLIVVGSHGRGGVDRIFLGSVAESVMRHAHCPVLVVRAPV
jgi:nucleotide-binding universal stress UspA family protein